jgi:hypothetical protein
MAMTFLEFADRRSKLGGLALDVLASEEINLEGQVTQYPVEDGTVISDHITQGTATAGATAPRNVTPLLESLRRAGVR